MGDDEKKVIEKVTEVMNSMKISIKSLLSKDGDESQTIKGMTEKINDVIKVTGESPVLTNVIQKTNKVNNNGVSDLMKICKFGNVELIKKYLENDQDLKKIDIHGRNCLHHAAMAGNIESMEWLIKTKKINKNVLDSQRKSPLFYTVINNKIKAFNYLLSIDARIQQQATGGVTIGMLAARLGHVDIVKIAHHKGLNIKTTDFKNKNILDYARAGKHPEVIKYLEIQLED